MDTDIDQQLRDYQREYLEFLDDDVSYSLTDFTQVNVLALCRIRSVSDFQFQFQTISDNENLQF